MNESRFLIVEDEFVVAENLRYEVELMGYKVGAMVSSGEDALVYARREPPDLVLMDIKLGGKMDGVEAATRLRRELDIPVLFLTAFADEGFLDRAKRVEPLGYLVKPYERKGLRAAVEVAVYKARMERRLKESESRFRSMFEKASVAYLALDASGRYLDFNAQFCELLGYRCEELRGKDIQSALSPESRTFHAERFSKLAACQDLRLELNLVRKDSRPLTVIFEGRPQYGHSGEFLRMHCMLHDISERKRIEEERLLLTRQRQQALKTESLNRVAGAIAHHFNNLMTVVMGNLELAAVDLMPGTACAENIDNAFKAARRLSEIGSFMLTYLGQAKKQISVLDLSALCSRSVSEFKDALPENITLRMDFPIPGPIVDADAGQIRQALIQLVINAWEAMGDSEGEIRMKTRELQGKDIPLASTWPLDWKPLAAMYGVIEVSDTGQGIAEGDIEKVMDPFYSTKFTGRGLGLAMVLGIARAHKGAVSVRSAVGSGSVFQMLIPKRGS